MFRRLLTVCFVCLLAASSSGTELFGNLRLKLVPAGLATPLTLTVGIDGEIGEYKVLGDDAVLIWQIRAGGHELAVTLEGTEIAASIVISPGLTSQVSLRWDRESEAWIIEQTGYADLTGVVVTLSSDVLANLPGELSDAVAPYTHASDGAVGYTWNGMSLRSSANGRRFTFENTSTPMSALISLTDPFAGSGDSLVTLTPHWSNAFRSRLQSLYGTRDQRSTRGDLQLPMPGNLGMLHAAVSYENSEDATPRSNVDYRLPHNSLDNLEITGGAELPLGSRFTCETDLLYKSYRRDVYLHVYYFDVPHMPRDEGYLYNARTTLYGWLTPTFFLNGSFDLHGDGFTIGDGKHFDDLIAYSEAESNYRRDDFNLFYDGDFPPVLDENDSCLYGCGDDGHFYDDFLRYRTNGFTGDLSLSKMFGSRTRLSLDAYLKRETYRYYHNSRPSNYDPAYHQFSTVGFAADGVTLSNDWLFDMPATPTHYGLKLSAQHLGRTFFAKMEINADIFDPHALTFRNLVYPLDAEGGMSVSLERSDLQEVTAKMFTGHKFGFGIHVSDDLTLFGRLSKFAEFPDYNLLYGDLEYNTAILNIGRYYVFQNPTLGPVWTNDIGAGLSASIGDFDLVFDYQHRTVRDMVFAYHQVPAFPKTWDYWSNGNVAIYPTEERLTCAIQTNLAGPFGGQLAVSYFSRDENWPDTSMNWIVAFSDVTFEAITRYAATGSCYLDLGKFATGSVPSILSRMRVDLQATARTGKRYTPIRIDNEVTLSSFVEQPIDQWLSGKARDFIEINAGLTARLLRSANQTFAIRLEILNLLDRENWERVYGGTGLPDNTAWLGTAEGEVWSDYNSGPDISGLTGPQKYQLRQNDPNNFGRPRIIRLLAQLSF